MRRTIALALALITALTAGRPLRAQPADSIVAIGLRATLHSAILGEDRPLEIHLPASYGAAPTARYPVVVVLDGPAHFAAVSAMTDFLAANSRAPELIVVAVDNTRDRTHDLTPPADTGVVRLALDARDTVSQSFPTAGGAARFRAFLTTELVPWVDEHYRTVPYRILVGHSFGGLLAIDALAHEPRGFNAYVAISPSLWWDRGRYVRRVEAALAHAPLEGRAVYMSTGAREGPSMIEPARELASALAGIHASGFRSWYAVMPTETHGSNPLRTTYDALEHIFAGWEPADSVVNAALLHGDLTGLEAHHAELTRRFGFAVPLSPDLVNSMAYFNLQQRRLDEALRLFRRNTDAAPDYANGWDSLADGLEASGKMVEALAAEERAVSVAERTRDPALPSYQAHLERLRKALGKP
jgi:predicted alpha/beta superfamily hydrolase